MGRCILLVSIWIWLCVEAQAQSLSCPKTPPPAWGLPSAQLRAVLVLSQPVGQAINEDALPIMAPTRQWQSKGMLHQSWKMNGDAPKFAEMIDCLYEGSERHLRLDASKVAQCTASSKISKPAAPAPSLLFRCK